ncbi:CDP-alcohol phosphatidyltransferase family protein [Yoonia sediminilitoris]|uniref:CDP-diacylglycerol--serine O-phosphatidyltransferase n=1 Tax=Yoonia sediminilitoris TaxID=1286148 RepID=A0A2T6KRJ5_9RHOB|nr:phosphatidylcholine/phosphatidylserine synthase [Yoonia sediminilitoris]PUB19182.1 CDP-diacylglycerol--serine O-phosphatidyltransferase [Yoonia sediminilitoris]RCW99350.1 CDP-diacylglycerol--serine O-phosphatidyltransferase [Yoonia sediminilitoris]
MASEGPARRDLPVIALLPNMVTLAAICAGLTSIRFGFQGDYERAVMLILLAGFLDGVDGRLARLLRSESKTGAELDSLADFLNFGVAAPLLLYLFVLHELGGAGWIAVLVFAVCAVIRLARFNVQSRSDQGKGDPRYFVGVPAPAGALLAMMPMYGSFLFSDSPILPAGVDAIWIVLVGLAMISRLPTYSFKLLTVSRSNVQYFLLGAIVLIAALLTYIWATLVVLNLLYIAAVLWAWRDKKR